MCSRSINVTRFIAVGFLFQLCLPYGFSQDQEAVKWYGIAPVNHHQLEVVVLEPFQADAYSEVDTLGLDFLHANPELEDFLRNVKRRSSGSSSEFKPIQPNFSAGRAPFSIKSEFQPTHLLGMRLTKEGEWIDVAMEVDTKYGLINELGEEDGVDPITEKRKQIVYQGRSLPALAITLPPNSTSLKKLMGTLMVAPAVASEFAFDVSGPMVGKTVAEDHIAIQIAAFKDGPEGIHLHLTATTPLSKSGAKGGKSGNVSFSAPSISAQLVDSAGKTHLPTLRASLNISRNASWSFNQRQSSKINVTSNRGSASATRKSQIQFKGSYQYQSNQYNYGFKNLTSQSAVKKLQLSVSIPTAEPEVYPFTIENISTTPRAIPAYTSSSNRTTTTNNAKNPSIDLDLIIGADSHSESISLANEKSRSWNDRTGKFSVQATLVQIEGAKVSLKKSDGKVIALELSKLSDDDQRYVAQSKKAASK